MTLTGHDGPDTIAFNISGGQVHTITLDSALPLLIDDATTIDGYTQPGASPATDRSVAALRIVIDGNLRTVDEGLRVTSADNVIRGLVIRNFSLTGIVIAGSGATSNTVSGNYIGTDVTGAYPRGNASSGVTIEPGAQRNIIGGATPGDRNVISGNLNGVSILGTDATSNTVSGNYIGTDAAGTSPLGNTTSGIAISGGAQDNTVGGPTPGHRNLISGNHGNGFPSATAGQGAIPSSATTLAPMSAALPLSTTSTMASTSTVGHVTISSGAAGPMPAT